MILTEKPFLSIQGEGRNTGKLAIFLRFSGCNLHCQWCDTKYSWKKGKDYREEWKEWLNKTKFIVVTGGEPLLRPECIDTLKRIRKVTLEVETNGTLLPIPPGEFNNIQYSISPKLQSSGEKREKRIKPEILKQFLYLDSAFKFSIDNKADLQEAKEIISEVNIPHKQVWLMPVVDNNKELKKKSRQILQYAIEEGFNFSSRLHIFLYGKKRGV